MLEGKMFGAVKSLIAIYFPWTFHSPAVVNIEHSKKKLVSAYIMSYGSGLWVNSGGVLVTSFSHDFQGKAVIQDWKKCC